MCKYPKEKLIKLEVLAPVLINGKTLIAVLYQSSFLFQVILQILFIHAKNLLFSLQVSKAEDIRRGENTATTMLSTSIFLLVSL